MHRLTAPIFILGLGMLGSRTGRASIVFSDNFLSYLSGGNGIANLSSLGSNWTVVQGITTLPTPYSPVPLDAGMLYTGEVDLIGGPFFGNTICTSSGDPEHGSTGAGGVDPCVDLAGSMLPAGAYLKSKAFTFVAGMTYVLSFDIAGSQRGNQNTVTAGFGAAGYVNLSTMTYTLNSADPFVRKSILYTPVDTAVGYLFFDNSSNDQTQDTCTFITGKLSCGYMGALIEDVTLSSAPELATAPLVGCGLVGLGIYALWRRLAATKTTENS